MKPRALLACLTLLLISLALVAQQKSEAKKSGAAHADHTAKNSYSPDEVKWGPAPPFIPSGAQLAVLEGNPMGATGDYTIRLKMPDGYKIAPHWHPKRENVTIISGTLAFGMGDTFDASKMKDFGPGSFAYLDPSMHHYVQAKGATEVQIHGMAPVKFNYINPADDPSRSKGK